jgi:uncharacterized protein
MTLPRRSLLLLPALALSTCASVEPVYYTLATVPGTSRPGGPKHVEIRRIGLAGYLDRNSIVRADTGVRLVVDANQVWAEPPADMIGRVLAQDLTERLPGTIVFSESGAISADPDATVEVNIQRFNQDRTGHVVLLAQVAIERGLGHRGVGSRTVSLSVAPPGPTVGDFVTALSGLLGQMADQVTEMLRGA